MLRVGVAVAFRRARLQLVYNVLRGKDLETGEVSAEPGAPSSSTARRGAGRRSST